MRSILVPVAIAALVVTASSAAAQSLADVARREEQRRAAIRTPARTISNAGLTRDSFVPPAPVSVQPSATTSSTDTPPTAPANAGAVAAVAAPAPDAKPKEDETYWRWRAGEYRARAAKAQTAVDGFAGVPQDDPREQARIAPRLKAAQEALKRANDQLRLLETQADVAGIPMDWIK